MKQTKAMAGRRYVKIFFTDKTSVAFSFEKQGGDDIATLAANRTDLKTRRGKNENGIEVQ